MNDTNSSRQKAALRKEAESRGWSILSEEEVQHGYQLVVSDGVTNVPVTFYTTGKVVVRGRASTLQHELLAWCSPSHHPDAQSTSAVHSSSVTTAQAPSAVQQGSERARIGSDESGKGDYFGPLVVAAVFVDQQTERQLLDLGVRDSKLLSDQRVLAMADQIKTLCHDQFEIGAYAPERYNQLYQTMGNLNRLLAQAHAKLIASLQKQIPCTLAIVDQFGEESLLLSALLEAGCPITLEQRHRAEDDLAVAAASIIARACFLRELEHLSQQVGLPLPKGASSPAIVQIGRQIVAERGEDALGQVAKWHFKTTTASLPNPIAPPLGNPAETDVQARIS